MPLAPGVEELLKKSCPELCKLPKGWCFRIEATKDQRIFFMTDDRKTTTHDHPQLGALPAGWQLRVFMQDGEKWPMYYDCNKRVKSKEDPRTMTSTISRQAAQTSKVAQHLQIAATTTKNRAGMNLQLMKRSPIDYKRNHRDQYLIVHTIDDGGGGLGGMNGGVFVVVMKGHTDPPVRFYIEKRFKPKDVHFCKTEIVMMHKLRHSAMATFVAGFILENKDPQLSQASVYIEFCDMGSLEDVIKGYIKNGNGSRPPEAFVWHAFLGLMDALAYLRDGVSPGEDPDARPNPKWIPILHRDIKPDNVLLRDRTRKPSTKYPYCVLSDFGLACEDRNDTDPLADQHQVKRCKLGSAMYFAPELLYPYWLEPENTTEGQNQRSYFPQGARHSCYSDVWALGACIYNLCAIGRSRNVWAHMDESKRTKGMDFNTWVGGTESHIEHLTIPNMYSPQLREAVLHATLWDVSQRRSGATNYRDMKQKAAEAGFDKQGASSEQLPSWAVRVHDYGEKLRVLLEKGAGKKKAGR